MTATDRLWKGVVYGIVGLLLFGLVVWLIVVYTGAYNVAATDEHAAVVRWTFDTTFHESVAARAEDVEAPEAVPEELIAAGADIYGSTCAHCHGGPGHERAYWATNMRPTPPELTHAAAEWELAEVFWIAKHGVKMTGMPAFGPAHSDAELWGVAAFVKRLPAMTAETYEAATQGAGSGGHGHGGSGHHGGSAQRSAAGQSGQ